MKTYVFWFISDIGSNRQQVNIGLNNGLALYKQWAFIRNNVDTVHQCIYVSPGLSELIHQPLSM